MLPLTFCMDCCSLAGEIRYENPLKQTKIIVTSKFYHTQEELREGNVKNHENLIRQLSEFLGTNVWILGDEVKCLRNSRYRNFIHFVSNQFSCLSSTFGSTRRCMHKNNTIRQCWMGTTIWKCWWQTLKHFRLSQNTWTLPITLRLHAILPMHTGRFLSVGWQFYEQDNFCRCFIPSNIRNVIFFARAQCERHKIKLSIRFSTSCCCCFFLYKYNTHLNIYAEKRKWKIVGKFNVRVIGYWNLTGRGKRHSSMNVSS